MAEPYLAIYNENGYGDINKQLYTLPPALQNKPAQDVAGVQILAVARRIAGGDPTFDHLFEAFKDNLVRGAWQWNPAGGGWNSWGLLDGTKLAGECKHFAQNLWFLARCPAPYGLGLRRDQIDHSKTYAGATGEGFISNHNGTFLGLRSNVRAAAGYGGTPLYYWADHKTVKYNDRFWDPCYMVTYDAEADMAAYQLTNVYARTDVDGLWDQGNMQTLGLQAEGKTAEKATRNNRYYYFRRMAAVEQVAGRAFEGPITETDLEVRRMRGQGLRVG